jgi:pyruvate ferredoxin oxidoreductase beta subunit
MVAHKIPYAAQADVSHWYDLSKKVEKALSINGPTFINILSPCPPGWRYPSDQSIELSRLAVETCFWPLYEVENGKYKVTYKPKEVRQLTDWFKPQGRFSHLFRPENKAILDEIQQQVHADWQALLKLESSL